MRARSTRWPSSPNSASTVSSSRSRAVGSISALIVRTGVSVRGVPFTGGALPCGASLPSDHCRGVPRCPWPLHPTVTNTTWTREGKRLVLEQPAAILRGVARSLTQLSQVQPGGHPLRREVLVHHQRRRILTAVVEVAAEVGYRATSVAAIIKRAGVSKLKFYENFSSKEDAFLAAYDEGVVEAAQRVAAAVEAAGTEPAARVDAGIDALLEFLCERPAL